MSGFQKALPTSQRPGFRMLQHPYYYCSTALILDAFHAEDAPGPRSPGRAPGALAPRRAPASAPTPPGLPRRAGTAPCRQIQSAKPRGAAPRGPGPPIWAPTGPPSCRSQARARTRLPPFPPPSPSGKNGGWAAAAANCGREAEGTGAGEREKEGLQKGGGDRGGGGERGPAGAISAENKMAALAEGQL